MAPDKFIEETDRLMEMVAESATKLAELLREPKTAQSAQRWEQVRKHACFITAWWAGEFALKNPEPPG